MRFSWSVFLYAVISYRSVLAARRAWLSYARSFTAVSETGVVLTTPNAGSIATRALYFILPISFQHWLRDSGVLAMFIDTSTIVGACFMLVFKRPDLLWQQLQYATMHSLSWEHRGIYIQGAQNVKTFTAGEFFQRIGKGRLCMTAHLRKNSLKK